MKIEKINLKGEKKARDRKKQGKNYIKPISNKNDNLKKNVKADKSNLEENKVKNSNNVNNNLQKTQKNIKNSNKTKKKTIVENKENTAKRSTPKIQNTKNIKTDKKDTSKTKNGRIGATHRSELLLDEIEEGIILSRAKETKKKEAPRVKTKEKKLKIIALGGLAEIGKNHRQGCRTALCCFHLVYGWRFSILAHGQPSISSLNLPISFVMGAHSSTTILADTMVPLATFRFLALGLDQ